MKIYMITYLEKSYLFSSKVLIKVQNVEYDCELKQAEIFLYYQTKNKYKKFNIKNKIKFHVI